MNCFSSAMSVKRAFTLIEILIVIVIIGLLAALLFPVFASVRDNARRATCASNLKQIGTAISLYVADNNRYYPPPHANRDLTCTWANNIFSYTKNAQIFHCPSYEQGEFRPGCPAPDTSVEPPLTWNGSYDIVPYTTRSNMRDSNLRHPTTTILVLDGDGSFVSAGSVGSGLVTGDPRGISPGPVLNEEWLLSNAVNLRHSVGGRKGDNVLWADGHVKWLSLEAMFDRHLWRGDESDQTAEREKAGLPVTP